jgi:nucleotide-binding universal stress UspA family protein
VRLTLKDNEHMRELVRQEKADTLEALAAPIRQRGIEVDTKVLLGKTSVEIIREVVREKHDLVMRVAKGAESRRHGFFGNTGFLLLRKCPCPVWLVAPNTTPQFEHVLACVDTSSGSDTDAELNDQVYELAASISQHHQGICSVVHSWTMWNEQMVKSRMHDDEFEQLEKYNHDQIEKQLNTFLQKHGSNAQADNVHLIKEEPFRAIPDFAREHGVDLVVMGTVGRSGLLGVTMGNTAEQILNEIRCSVLAIKPTNFESPIKES